MSVCNDRGVCPRLLLTPWAAMVQNAMTWWEQGSLGITFLECPAWLHEAFGIISRARTESARYRAAIEAAKRKAQKGR